MASIRKRGSSYLLVMSMGYNSSGKRRTPKEKNGSAARGDDYKANGEVAQ